MKSKRGDSHDLYKKASPFWRIGQVENIPPMMVVHGTIDTLVPYDDGREFFRELTKRREQEFKSKSLIGVEDVTTISTTSDFKNPVDIFVKLPHTHHAFNFIISPRTLALGDAVVDFLNNIYTSEKGKNSKL